MKTFCGGSESMWHISLGYGERTALFLSASVRNCPQRVPPQTHKSHSARSSIQSYNLEIYHCIMRTSLRAVCASWQPPVSSPEQRRP